MKPRVLVVLLFALSTFAALRPTATASECSQPLKQCLFSDGPGCSIDCPPETFCLTRSAYCSFGFGVAAQCSCVRFKCVTVEEL
jgi:hypothetical protein